MNVVFDRVISINGQPATGGEVETYVFRLFGIIPIPGVRPHVGETVLVGNQLVTIVQICD